MEPIKEKTCRHCKMLLPPPNPRNATRQAYCRKPECRIASKAASQKRWTKKPENRKYFCGQTNVERVQEWRKKHSGYWRKKPGKTVIALQEALNVQPAAENMDTVDTPSGALQDFMSVHHIVLLGLIANFTGSALQDNMAITIRRLLRLGQDVVKGEFTLKLAEPLRSPATKETKKEKGAAE